MTVRVVLVDDHEMLRAGLMTILSAADGIEVVGEAADGRTAVQLAGRLRPDLVVMDVEMPGGDGITATAQIRQLFVEVQVMVLTTFDVDDYVLGALRVGASGFLLKTTPPLDLIAGIKACARGDTYLGPTVVQRLVETYVERRPGPVASVVFAALTNREMHVLKVMARGNSNAEIGHELYLAETTVKTHVARILAKLGMRDRVQVVVLAHESGLMRQ